MGIEEQGKGGGRSKRSVWTVREKISGGGSAQPSGIEPNVIVHLTVYQIYIKYEEN